MPCPAPLRLALTVFATVVVAPPLPAQSAPEPVASTARFDLRSAPRSALFHFLLDWALADAGEWPGFAVPLAERDSWRQTLSPEEQRTWESAVRAFALARSRSLLFDPGMLAVRDWAGGAVARDRIPATDAALAAAVESTLPVYQRHWWDRHHQRNRAWIEAVTPTLRTVEDDVVRRIEAAYGGTWPAGRVPVDVVPYANPVGAYSSGGRLTLSSLDRENGSTQAVELVFHEASHTDSLEAPLREAIRAAFRAAGGQEPDRFWHDVIFFTAGEATRLALERVGHTGYRHYGETAGVYGRGARWQVELPAFRRHWTPFLESASTDATARRQALERVAADVLRWQSGER